MQFEIRHSMPGRVRLRVRELKYNAAAAQMLSQFLKAREGVTRVIFNPHCASLLIEYKSHRRHFQRDLEATLGRIVLQELRVVPTPPKVLAKPSTQIAAISSPQPWFHFYAMTWPSISVALCLLGGPIAVVNLGLIVSNGWPTWTRALQILRTQKRLNVDFLDGLALLVAILQGSFFTAAAMVWLINLGDWIREKTAGKSKRAIGALLNYQGRQAWVKRKTGVIRVLATDVRTGDRVVIYPGELIPVDGRVLEGAATVDQKTITGESLPVHRSTGNTVYAGTVVRDGKLTVKATRVGEETTAAQIVHLVEEAPIGETRIQNYAERFADRLVAPSLAFGGGLLCLTGNVNRFLSMTIIDYGTGMRVAAPTSVLSSMTHAARQGIVIKSGSHIEKLASVDTVIFDKTGTLTRGVPEILDVIAYNERHFPAQKIISLAAAVEARFNHPVADAITAKALEHGIVISSRKDSKYHIGLGVEGRVNGHYVHVGNERFLDGHSIDSRKAAVDLRHLSERGRSVMFFAVDGVLQGLLPYADQVRPESRRVVASLTSRGVRDTIMLTGDNSTVASVVAEQVSIRHFFANTMPGDKAEIVRDLQRKGRVVAMVGDGINDSPALAYADVGIAMKNGADVARESADVILMEDNLEKLVGAMDISRDAMKLIRQNYAIIAGLNTFALLLALPTSFVSPSVTAFISNGSAILASLNAIRPILRYGTGADRTIS